MKRKVKRQEKKRNEIPGVRDVRGHVLRSALELFRKC